MQRTPTRLKLLDEPAFGDRVFLAVEVVRATIPGPPSAPPWTSSSHSSAFR